MSDAPREHRRFGPGNMGQGSHRFKESLIDGAVGDVAAVYQKVIDATEGLPQIPWHRFVRVLPIAFEPHRIYVSKKNTAICRVGEIWPRFIGSGIRFQNGVWLNKATGRVWVLEPRTKDDFSCIHFDSMHDRMAFNDWLAAVWQIAFVDSQGSLPYKKGHASSSDQYFAVDDGGKILPSEDGRYPWSEWENRYLADRRREIGAVPKTDHREAAGGTGGEGGDGQDGARRGGNGSPDEDHDGGRNRAGVREQPRHPEHGPHHGNDQGDGELHDQHEGRPGSEDAGERGRGEDGGGDVEAT